MSTQQLVDAILRKAPKSDPETVLELLVSCDGDIEKTLQLLGVTPTSKLRQSTLGGIVKTRKLAPATKSAAKSTSRTHHLFTPEQVKAASIDCVMFENVLDSDLATSLLGFMLEDSRDWEKHDFYLFDRKVSSPHLSQSYTCNAHILEHQDSTYQGRTTGNVRAFTRDLHAARDAVEKIVKKVLPKLNWYSDLVVCNKYTGSGSGVGWHSDQLTHLGPKPVISGLSLGAEREFCLKRRSEKKKANQYNIHLRHNSLILMLPGCQENWKHSIPATSAVGDHALAGSTRISLTFRMYPPEYSTKNLPKCRCNKPMILRTTTDESYKYIWQCGQSYVNNVGCGLVQEAKDLKQPGSN